MKSSRPGRNTLKAEVVDISTHGVWILAREHEYFLPFKNYPWFKSAKISEIHNVQQLSDSHLYWPELDIDLEVESLADPAKYPLIYK